MEDSPETLADDVPIVGVGASAGGLEALVDLVSSIPSPSEACFVVVQHLSPDQKSVLHELLQAHSQLPVKQIPPEGEVARRAHVYVVPPGKLAEVEGGMLVLQDRDGGGHLYRPVDHFFQSLAQAKGREALCVVLSGTGSDGAAGLKAIKASGGIALVQESAGARFPGMPDSPVATGLVDFVLPADAIAGRLSEILHHRRQPVADKTRQRLHDAIEQALPELAARLSEVTGHDFADYKPGTLVRRIERRMSLLQMNDLQALVRLLARDPDQANLLAQEFLIGVTEFFRDPEAFEALRQLVVIPTLERSHRGVRVWVPGCSTGEEAYSLAMLFMEEMKGREDRRTLQVFGTDIDTHALLGARNGTFPAASVANLGEARLSAFFQADGGHFRARAELRERCVFAPHNLIQDPPFSRLDLISCRNLLIYLSPELQKRVVPRFHFSLREGGALFLGPSEGLSGQDDLFELVDKNHRIFLRNDAARAAYSSLADLPRRRSVPARPGQPAALANSETSLEPSREAAAEREFLRRYAAPFAILSAGGELLYLSDRMTDFVRPSQGPPSHSLDSYLAPELRVPVRAALLEARETEAECRVENVVASLAGKARLFDISVAPLTDDPTRFLLVLQEVRTTDASTLGDAVERRDPSNRDALETENSGLRKQLTATLQDFETSGQELKSTNEGLMSMNEELQLSNEELETSREELQSINEELETVNAELRENNRQLTRSNSDLANLFEATDVAVLFLDREFCVRNFTPSTTALFGIKRRDVGRPIFDLSSRIDYPDLRQDAANVDETLQPVEREVRIPASDETFLLRVNPYRTTDNRIDGYVLSFVDITSRKTFEETLQRNQRELARQYAELENLYDTNPVGLALMDRDGRWLRINDTLAEINGFPREAHENRTIHDLLPDLAAELLPIHDHVFSTGEAIRGKEIVGQTGAEPRRVREFICDFYPVRIDDQIYAVGTTVREVTEQKKLLRELEESEARMKRLFDAAPVFVAITEGPDHVYTYSNPLHDRVTGFRDLIGKAILEALPELEGQGIVERFDHVYRTGKSMRVPEFKAHLDLKGDGTLTEGWYAQNLEPLRDGDGNVIGVATFAYDITDLVISREMVRQQNEHQKLLLGELQHRVKNTLAIIGAISKMLMDEGGDARQYQKRLDERLQAIARTHDLLTEGQWTRASLGDLIRGEARPYQRREAARITIHGPDIDLDSRQTTSLGMAVHELMTNAVKYGALSNDDGRIDVTTRVDETDGRKIAHVEWVESGGPPVADPGDRSGFGTLVLGKVLRANLGGEVTIDYRPDGLRFTVSFDL